MSIETSSQSNRAADRLKQFDAKLQEDKYWNTQIGEAGETDFSEDARTRLKDVALYDAHLEKIANDETYGTLDASLDNAENGAYKDSIDRMIEANPKLRRIVLMANIYNNLRNQTNDSAIDDVEKRVDQKEQDLLEALVTFEETSVLDADDITEIINRISNRMYAETPVASTDAPTAKKDTGVLIDTEAMKNLAAMEAADVSLGDDDEKVTPMSDDNMAALADMEAADVSLMDEDNKDADTFLDMNEIQELAAMEAADVSITDSDRESQIDELSDEDKAALADMEAADVPAADDDEKASSFIDVEAIKAELENDSIDKNHQRNRFNPFYRAQLAFNNFRTKNKERGSRSDNERSRASKIAIGAAAFGALALASVVIAKNNPDLVENIQDWMGDLGKNLGFDTHDTPQNDVTTGAEQPSGDTNDALNPTDPSDNANTPEAAPFASELLNAPAFNTPNGGGGELLMTNLGVDTQKWYSISADLPDLFPTEFYREQLPSGLVDIRFSHPGLLSEDAQKVLLQRLGK